MVNGNFDSYSYECACVFVSLITLLLLNQFPCFQKNILLPVYNSRWLVLSHKELQENDSFHLSCGKHRNRSKERYAYEVY